MEYILLLDSGIGGVNLLSLCKHLMPHENFLYFADTKNLPYGNKSAKKITDLVRYAIKTIQKTYKLRMIVLACNTATATSAQTLRKEFTLPIVGIEPAIKKAVDTGHKNILVLSTKATNKQSKVILKYKNYPQKMSRIIFKKDKHLAQMIEHAVPYKTYDLLNKLNLKINNKTTMKQFMHNYPTLIDAHECIRISNYLQKKYGALHPDAVVLGCTHYIFAKDILQHLFNVPFYDSCFFVARRIKQILILNGNLITRGKGSVIFL